MKGPARSTSLERTRASPASPPRRGPRGAGDTGPGALIRDLVTDESGIITLCASTGRQFALESNEHCYGLFTLAIVEGLRGKATMGPDDAVYLHHLDAYVTDRVKELSQGRNRSRNHSRLTP